MELTQKNRFDENYILALPFEDGVKHLNHIMSNEYKYQKYNDAYNQKVESFLMKPCFIKHLEYISIHLDELEEVEHETSQIDDSSAEHTRETGSVYKYGTDDDISYLVFINVERDYDNMKYCNTYIKALLFDSESDGSLYIDHCGNLETDADIDSRMNLDITTYVSDLKSFLKTLSTKDSELIISEIEKIINMKSIIGKTSITEVIENIKKIKL